MKEDTRPLIGVINGHSMGLPLRSAGAETVAISSMLDLANIDQLDGIVLCGGQDVAPTRYGITKPNWDKSVYTDKRRDEYEFEAVNIARENGLTMMGVCRGAQLLNVAHGGTLIQDITDIQHDDHWGHMLPAYWKKRSIVAGALDDLMQVGSHYHHQAVDRIGEGLVAAAWSEEGFVEAFESVGSPFVLGTQFHPEIDWAWDNDAEHIFEVFVDMTRPRFTEDTYKRQEKFINDTTPEYIYESVRVGNYSTAIVRSWAKDTTPNTELANLDEYGRWTEWDDDEYDLDKDVPTLSASKLEHERKCDLACMDGPCWDPDACDPEEGDCMRLATSMNDEGVCG